MVCYVLCVKIGGIKGVLGLVEDKLEVFIVCC